MLLLLKIKKNKASLKWTYGCQDDRVATNFISNALLIENYEKAFLKWTYGLIGQDHTT